MLRIGLRNLTSQPGRLVLAVCGVVFAVVLVLVEGGMLLGMVRNASLLVDRSRADLWVSTVNVKTFDFATPLPRRKRFLIESVPGVERVEEYNVSYSVWKLKSGGNANCQVVGFDPRGRLAAPLELSEGDLQALCNQQSVIIDEAERGKLENPRLGERVEVLERRARVAGFTRGMRSFTTTPYVFAALSPARAYGYQQTAEERSGFEQAVYFLVQVRQGSEVEAVRRRIQALVPDVEVHTRAEFSWRTRIYWILETGAGVGFLVAGLLGLLVGGVIVSQTLLAVTVERLPEYGILKALGADMRDLALVVLGQSLLCLLLGLALGMGLSVLVSWLVGLAGGVVILTAPLLVTVGGLTTVLCVVAALSSIARLRHLEPAEVFRA